MLNLMCKMQLKMQLCGNTPADSSAVGESHRHGRSKMLQSPIVKRMKSIWSVCVSFPQRKEQHHRKLWGQTRATSCINKLHEKYFISGWNPDLTCVPFALEGRKYRRQSLFRNPMDLPLAWIQRLRSYPCTAAKETAPQRCCSPVQLMSWHNRNSAFWGYSVCKLVSAANRHKLIDSLFSPQDNFFSCQYTELQ